MGEYAASALSSAKNTKVLLEASVISNEGSEASLSTVSRAPIKLMRSVQEFMDSSSHSAKHEVRNCTKRSFRLENRFDFFTTRAPW